MKCTLILFSPTGGTEKAARILCRELGDPVTVCDLSSASFRGEDYAAQPDSVAVIAVPSFGGRVPAVAAERIRSLRGNGTPCVALCVYGNRAYEDTLIELADLAREAGFQVAAGVAAVAEHSIVHQYASGRPDGTDEANLREIGKKIAEKLAQPGEHGEVAVPGNRPYQKAGAAGLVPKAGSACVACGLCAAQCPVGAIDRQEIKKADKQKCISCMRCVARCPQKARTVNGAMVSVAAMTIKKACSVRKECEVYL